MVKIPEKTERNMKIVSFFIEKNITLDELGYEFNLSKMRIKEILLNYLEKEQYDAILNRNRLKRKKKKEKE